MTTRHRCTIVLALAVVAMTGFVLNAAAKDIPAQLADPDGKAGDASKPVKVYILAGQSNMVGMGNLSGARCRYTGIYLTADPAAPKGVMGLYRVGTYKIDRFPRCLPVGRSESGRRGDRFGLQRRLRPGHGL